MVPNQFCYTGYCGDCITSGGCIAPAQCVLGVCQNPPPDDGGVDAGNPPPDAGPDAGTMDAGGDAGQSSDGGDGGAMADGGTGGGCGCSSSPGAAAEIALLALVLLAIFSPRRRREG
jgi:MYXO-CTERM domain-containing protein